MSREWTVVEKRAPGTIMDERACERSEEVEGANAAAVMDCDDDIRDRRRSDPSRSRDRDRLVDSVAKDLASLLGIPPSPPPGTAATSQSSPDGVLGRVRMAASRAVEVLAPSIPSIDPNGASGVVADGRGGAMGEVMELAVSAYFDGEAAGVGAGANGGVIVGGAAAAAAGTGTGKDEPSPSLRPSGCGRAPVAAVAADAAAAAENRGKEVGDDGVGDVITIVDTDEDDGDDDDYHEGAAPASGPPDDATAPRLSSEVPAGAGGGEGPAAAEREHPSPGGDIGGGIPRATSEDEEVSGARSGGSPPHGGNGASPGDAMAIAASRRRRRRGAVQTTLSFGPVVRACGGGAGGGGGDAAAPRSGATASSSSSSPSATTTTPPSAPSPMGPPSEPDPRRGGCGATEGRGWTKKRRRAEPDAGGVAAPPPPPPQASPLRQAQKEEDAATRPSNRGADGAEAGARQLQTKASLPPLDVLSPQFDAVAVATSYRAQRWRSPPFAHLCQALASVGSTTKRLVKQRALANLLLVFLYHDRWQLRGSGPEEHEGGEGGSTGWGGGDGGGGGGAVLLATLLAGNVVTHKLTLNVGHSSISGAICSALSCTPTALRRAAAERGKMGDAAADILAGGGSGGGGGGGVKRQARLVGWARAEAPPRSLSVGDVMDALVKIHGMGNGAGGGGGGGSGVEKKRKDVLIKLLSAAARSSEEEVRFAVKILCSNVRTGATLVTVMSCLAAAVVLHDRGMIAAQVDGGGGPPKKKENSNSKKKYDGSKGDAAKEGEADPNHRSGGDGLKLEVDEAQRALRAVYARHHDLEACVAALVRGGLGVMAEECDVAIGVPLQPMLAGPCRSAELAVSHYRDFYDRRRDDGGDEIYASATAAAANGDGEGDGAVGNVPPGKGREGERPFFTAEYKYDGQRAQIHFLSTAVIETANMKAQTIKIFSRHLEDITTKFRPVVDWFESRELIGAGLRSFILDAEICAVRRSKVQNSPQYATGTTMLLPFQVLSTMKRDADAASPAGTTSSNATRSNDDVGLCVFAYDILFLNGEPLVDSVLRDRRRHLRSTLGRFVECGRFELAKGVDVTFGHDLGKGGVSPIRTVEDFLLESIEVGRCEGLMLKSLSSTYDACESREKSGGDGGWRKLKKDYVDSLADSIDVVPIGAWRGSGRKSSWFSPFLLAVYDATTGDFQSLCRCMSGFSDDFYKEKYELYSKRIVNEKPDYVSTNENPPFWFDPWESEVWEIRGADLTLSPVHFAAKGMVQHGLELSDRGLALRFPRFIRLRDDKSVDEATTSSEVLSLFHSQSQRN